MDLAIHPGGSNCCTCAAATWPGVAHAENSKWSFLVCTYHIHNVSKSALHVSAHIFDAR
jgi:hypothetical protein